MYRHCDVSENRNSYSEFIKTESEIFTTKTNTMEKGSETC